VSRAFWLWPFVCLFQACAGVKNAPADAGVLGIYRAPSAAVRASAIEALREGNFAVAEDRPGRLLATGYAASGARLAARVTFEDRGGECAVRVYVGNDAEAARAIQERLARRLNLPAPPPPLPAASGGGIERVYRSMLTVCFDGALRACRQRDYRLREEKRTGDHAGAIGGEGKAFTVAIQMHRRSDNRTRVIIQVRGRSPAENRDEATALLEKLREELKEIAE